MVIRPFYSGLHSARIQSPRYGACSAVVEQLHQYACPTCPQSQQLGWVTLSSREGRESIIIHILGDTQKLVLKEKRTVQSLEQPMQLL